MNDESVYSSKLRTPDEVVSSIASGSTVALGMAMSQPPSLLAALAARASAGDVDALKVYYFHAESFLQQDAAAIRTDGAHPAALHVPRPA